jgi:hypothetical protein
VLETVELVFYCVDEAFSTIRDKTECLIRFTRHGSIDAPVSDFHCCNTVPLPESVISTSVSGYGEKYV